MEANSVYLFICEDQELSREIMEKYFPQKKITYAAIYDAGARGSIVRSLEGVQNRIFVTNQPLQN